MPIRCLLFSSDTGTAEPIRQVLASLGVEGQYCPEAAAAIEQVTHQSFQIVIIDWDNQPEAGLLLNTARERKASQRPLTLAIVSDDASVPKALQAGANSILRKPLQGNQVKDTLTTARDLLRAKQQSAAASAQAAAAGASWSSSTIQPVRAKQPQETPVRTENSTEPSLAARRANVVAISHAPDFVSALDPIVPPKHSERAAAPVVPVVEERPARSSSASPSPLPPDGPKGLEWYLKTRAVTPTIDETREPAAPAPAKPELVGFGQASSTPSKSAPPNSNDDLEPKHNDVQVSKKEGQKKPEQKKQESNNQEANNEEELFAYMDGETKDSKRVAPPSSSMRGAIIGALLLAGCAILAAPQAPWHSTIRGVWTRGQRTMHGWLNPQPVNPVQAPVAHEDFGRAGDEYKLPVSENIPDATTDPSQIQVVPVVDPTAKKPNNATNPEQFAPQPDGAGGTIGAPTPVSGGQPSPSTSGTAPLPGGSAPGGISAPAVAPTVVSTPHSDSSPSVPPISAVAPSAAAQPAPPKNRPPRAASTPGNVPSSLKSQIASMAPDASGNKPPEAAMDSIEPVAISEAAERALLTDQPAIDYPPNATGQQGTVVLQVLIGRDGTVQDAKFLQGSLAFARTAIDGVKLWKFKPYSMNGRAVSVQTSLTMSFKPAQ